MHIVRHASVFTRNPTRIDHASSQRLLGSVTFYYTLTNVCRCRARLLRQRAGEPGVQSRRDSHVWTITPGAHARRLTLRADNRGNWLSNRRDVTRQKVLHGAQEL